MIPLTGWARHQTSPPLGPLGPLKTRGPLVSGTDQPSSDFWMGELPAPWRNLQLVPGTDLSPTWESYSQQGLDPIEEFCCLPGVAFVPKDAAWIEAGPREGGGPRARVGDLSGAGAGDTEEAGMP